MRDSMYGASRYDPYGPPRKMQGPMGRMSRRSTVFGVNLSKFSGPPSPHASRSNRDYQTTSGDSFARELLELYLKDAEAFDRYARDPIVQRSLNITQFDGTPSRLEIKPEMCLGDYKPKYVLKKFI